MATVRQARRPVVRRWATGLAGVLFAFLALPAAPASAHAALVRTSPAQGSVIGGPPSEIVLTFSEPVRLVRDRVHVLAPNGKRISGEPAVAGAVVTIPVREADEPLGTYLVSYRVISADSHPVAGSFTFSAGAPSPPPPDPDAGGGVDPVVRIAVPVAKYLGYAGLVLLVGPALVLARLWPRRLSRRGPARLIAAGLGLVAAGALAGLWLQAPYGTGTGVLDVSGGDLREVATSRFGVALLARLVLLVVAALLLRPVLREAGGRAHRITLAGLGVALLATWPLSGHAGASPVPPLTGVTDAVHLGSMAVWVGGLVVLFGFLLRRANEAELGEILPAWSRWAMLAVCWLVLSGAVQAVVEVGSVPALLRTDYGRLVLAKVGLLACVVAVAAYSRRLVRRGVAARPSLLRRSVLVEVGIVAVVLAVSATLVQTTPARTAVSEPTPVQSGGFAQTLRSSLFTVQFDVYPVELGENNTLHVFVYTPDGQPLPVVEWKVTAALPAQGIEPMPAPLAPLTPNHALGSVNFLARGDWQLRFTLRVSEVDQATVSTTIPVR